MPRELWWEEPPEDASLIGRTFASKQVMAALRERPGVWARIAEGLTRADAAAVYAHFHRYGYEASRIQTTGRHVPVEDKRFSVYARFPGTEES